MGVQIVHYQRYLFCLLVVACNIFQEKSPVLLGFSFSDFDHALAR
jgi:hypothetical protein